MIKFIISITALIIFVFAARECNKIDAEINKIGRYSKIVTMSDGTQYKVRQIMGEQYPIVTLVLADGTFKEAAVAQIKDISYVGEHTGK